jgi:hypothetical protein
MASFKAKRLSRPLVFCALLLAFAAISPLAIALGQTAPGSPIVSDLPVAAGTERVLFDAQARQLRAAERAYAAFDTPAGIVNLASGGMLVVSVAQRLGSEGHLLAYRAAPL